jgi:hypothetical protein
MPGNIYWTQGAWVIDPQNVSGTASDGNSGADATHALVHYSELLARWGTQSPRLRQDTVITFLSSHTDDTDAVYLTPALEHGASCILQGTLGAAQQVAAGVLAGVVAKNRAGPQLLNATLGAGVAAGTFVTNTTAGKLSACWVFKNVAGNTWALSQPLARQAAPFVTTPSEVDTWANGDTYVAFTPLSIALADVGAELVDFNAGVANTLVLQNFLAFSPAPNISTLQLSPGVYLFSEVSCARIVDSSPFGAGVSNAWSNCDISAVAWHIHAAPTQIVVWAGGQQRTGGSISNAQLTRDAIVGGFTTVHGSNSSYSAVYIDTAKNLTWLAQNVSAINPSPVIWGPGILAVQGGCTLHYPSGAGGAVATFLQTGGFALNSGATAYSVGTGAAAVWNGGITVTAAALDAAVGIAGFGGIAVVPGGASINARPS